MDAVGYVCDYCQKAVKNEIHIVCAQCPELPLCLECFSVGVEPKQHLRNHNYRVVGDVKYPVFEPGWSIDEELFLLECVQANGLANWHEIAANIKGKTASECRDHYHKIYLQSSSAPLPNPPSHERVAPMAVDGEDTSVKFTPVPHVGAAKLGNAYAQFYPAREDFETEYDNDAELLVRDIVFYDDDTPLDRTLKATMLEIYNARLDRREAQKKVCMDYKLAKPEVMGVIHSDSDAKEFEQRMRPFAKYHGPEEHIKLLQTYCEVVRLRKHAIKLRNYIKNGVTTMKESTVYEQAKRKREIKKKPAKGTTGTNRRGPTTELVPSAEESLSKSEEQLVSAAKLLPHEYLVIKARLLYENSLVHAVTIEQAISAVQSLVSTSESNISMIVNFLHTNGWIRASGTSYTT